MCLAEHLAVPDVCAIALAPCRHVVGLNVDAQHVLSENAAGGYGLLEVNVQGSVAFRGSPAADDFMYESWMSFSSLSGVT